jgi:hypothetical protein
MKTGRTIWIVSLIILIIAGYFGFKYFCLDQGTANGVSELQNVYRRGGAPLAAAYTNALIQKFPFKGSLNWEFWAIRSSFISLSGEIDTNKLPEFIRANPGIQFAWSGHADSGLLVGDSKPTDYPIKGEGKVKWERVTFEFKQPVGKYSVIFAGTIDLNSQIGKIRTGISEY